MCFCVCEIDLIFTETPSTSPALVWFEKEDPYHMVTVFITLDIHLTQLNALYQHYKDHISRVSAPHGHVLHHIECIQFDI